MARIQLTPPGTPDLSFQAVNRGALVVLPASIRSRRFLTAVLGLVGGIFLLVTLTRLDDSTAYFGTMSQSSRAQLERVWQRLGTGDSFDLDHPCERTLLWKFTGKSGFGSEYGMFLRYASAICSLSSLENSNPVLNRVFASGLLPMRKRITVRLFYFGSLEPSIGAYSWLINRHAAHRLPRVGLWGKA